MGIYVGNYWTPCLVIARLLRKLVILFISKCTPAVSVTCLSVSR
jgi:hypothetical protein